MRLTVIGISPSATPRAHNLDRDSGADAARPPCRNGGLSRVQDEISPSHLLTRRAMLSLIPMALVSAEEPETNANVLEDVTRKAVRPDLEFQQALIILLDARSVLRRIQVRHTLPFQTSTTWLV